MQLHQTAAQGLSLFLSVTVIEINLSLQLINHTTLLGYASLSTFFPTEVHKDEVDYCIFPKPLTLNTLQNAKTYQKMFLLILHCATTSLLTLTKRLKLICDTCT